MVIPKKKIYQLSYLRAAACIAVVLLHVAAFESILYRDSLEITQQFAATAVYMMMYWAVPVFVMVSGVLLLDPDKEIPLSRIFTRYIRRVLLALIIFGLLFRLFDIVMDGEELSAESLMYGFYEIFTGSGWSHLWYLYLLTGMYLMLPVFRRIASACRKSELRYFILIMFLFISVLPLTRLWDISSGFYIYISTIYPLYFFLGYAMHNDIISIPRWAAAVLMVLGSAGLLGAVFVSVYELAGTVSNLLGYSSVFVVMQAVGIFGLFDKMETDGATGAGQVLENIDGCSFGIYLVHMVFVRYLMRYRGLDLYDYNPVLAYAAVTMGIFLLTWIIVYLLRCIPFIRKLGII